MYKVKFSVKESFFAEYGAEQEKTVSKEELIDMLKDAKIFVTSCIYVGVV